MLIYDYIIQIEIVSFATHCFFLWGQDGDHHIKPVSAFLPASTVWEETEEIPCLLWGKAEAKYWRAYCPIGSHLSNCFLQGADRIQLKSDRAYRISIKKLSHVPSTKLLCGLGPQVKCAKIYKS
jgi:hypothetical protein